jgi:hypothetical protein
VMGIVATTGFITKDLNNGGMSRNHDIEESSGTYLSDMRYCSKMIVHAEIYLSC